MTEARTTAAFGATALVLVILAWATGPRVAMPDEFSDRGGVMFPAFRDPGDAASLEVIALDAPTGTVRPLKVRNRGGRWTIPSHYDHPADASDRLATIAAALIALKKDDIASDAVADHGRLGVLDPLDVALPGPSGRGTRVIVRGAADEVLADVILGAEVERAQGFRYVRVHGQRRVYTSRVGALAISTAFHDWIERDVLNAAPDEIDAVNLRSYALDRGSGRVEPGETLLLEQDRDGRWRMNGLAAGEALALDAVDRLLRGLTGMRIAGVLPKPPGITATLSREVSSTVVTRDDRNDLAQKGFHLTPDGRLLSNRGEVVVRTIRGVFYTLRIGDLAPGEAMETPATSESRYLFIMVDFDSGSARSPALATEGAARATLLRARFAPWYYIITADSLASIQMRRSDLVRRAP